MNEFEKDVQDKSNDFVPSVLGFVVSFSFFALIFIIANVVDVASYFK
ncbi:YqzM family protein [Shouchella lonarensis]|uniref:YqzM-like protein n=1 Tax=Shouchella lonarensis TaxID=1464122 RepID=A0A1G6KH26_9BACI|nr:YqzM family protein [Shouchella lonarensis]SDC30128.1 YqzM-like protein [Shouchella lonarensis]